MAEPAPLPAIGETITVRKLLHDGTPSYTWDGSVVASSSNELVLEALFTRGPRDLGYVVLEPDDLFVEFYYYAHWFNIFQIFKADGTLKGWYCNIGRPPRLHPGELHYVDLALDLFVYPDGRELVLDEDEFQELSRSTYARSDVDGAVRGLEELQSWTRAGRLPRRGSIRVS
jgi:protein associated with RNAse G/E